MVFWIVMMNRANGGGGAGGAMKFGKARTRLGSEEKNKKTFADVAGADEEKAELQELVEFLKNPKAFTQMGARIPKGVLLVHPPGAGGSHHRLLPAQLYRRALSQFRRGAEPGLHHGADDQGPLHSPGGVRVFHNQIQNLLPFLIRINNLVFIKIRNIL